MTLSQRLISCFIIGHVIATLAAAIPGLDDFGTFPMSRTESEYVGPLTASLDRAAAQVIWLHRLAWNLTTPVRRATDKYVRVTSLYQKWNMFWNPSRRFRYARVGYRLTLDDGSMRTEYQNIMPAGPTDQWKLVSAYFDSFTDKALTVAGERYHDRAASADSRGEALSDEERRQVLRPYTRYFGHRRIEAGLPPGTRLTAVEFWWGISPMPPPGVDTGRRFTDPSSAIQWERLSVDDQW